MSLHKFSVRILLYSFDLFIQLFLFLLLIYYCSFKNYITTEQVFISLVLSIIWYFSANIYGVYDEFRSRDFSFELISILKNCSIQLISFIGLFFLFKEASLRRIIVIIYPLSLFIIISSYRFFFRRFLNTIRKKGRNIRSVLIIGAGEVGIDFYHSIVENPHFGYRVVGFLDDARKMILNGKYLGPIEKLEEILKVQQVDEVIVALPNYANERLECVISTCNKFTTRVKIIPDYFKYLSERFEVTTFGKFPIIAVRNDKLNEFHWRLIKRGFDTIFSLFLLIFVFSWLFPILGIIIKLDSKGPIFFKQERWGRNNKKFYAYKFRSMKKDCIEVDQDGKYQQAKKNDPRLTRIGKILRKTNLDELPQFINVLKGEMSVVGPRPHPTPLNLESRETIRNYMLRHLVKPGITGWAQVRGFRGETDDPLKMKKRVEHDIWYIENWTIWLDMQIIFLTIWNMLKGDPRAY